MSRFAIQSALCAGMLAVGVTSASAQYPQHQNRGAQPAYYTQPPKVRINPNQRGGPPQPLGMHGGNVEQIPPQAGYVQLHAPLYPVPTPNVPYQVGSTYITNQAFAPHEMLWSHRYRALYPPYYYRVNGHWHSFLGTMNRYERWELQGTEVNVEYCSQKPLKWRFANIFSH